MRLTQSPFTIVLCVASWSAFLCGCGGRDMTPQGPEKGSVQAYLDEHPELLEEPEEVSEEDEFAAAGDE